MLHPPMTPMPPPLIPLPSPDSNDPFGNLFSDPGPSTPLFAPSSPKPRPELPPTPSSSASEFGAFVSVPATMDPLYQHRVPPFTPLHDVPSSSEFFDRFTDEAKERAGNNERRVLDELLEHEDDPLYWLTPERPPSRQEDTADATKLVPVDDDDPPPAPSLSASFTSTLSRRWMSTLLSNSLPSPARTTTPDPSTSPPQFTPLRHDSHTTLSHTAHPSPPAPLPPPSLGVTLTHASPFAPHTFVPPTGAPGFAGDRRWNNGGFEFRAEDEKPRSVVLTARRNGTTPVLTDALADQLRTSLPALPRLAKTWTLLYSLDQHGVSLQTFYARCAAAATGAGTLLAVRDSEDRVFGAWMGERVRMAPGAYYGSGESFLWGSRDGAVDVYKWTGKNEYVALCEPGFVSFGGGEGKYGLYLDANLIDGSSAPCPTFDNRALCGGGDDDGGEGTVPFECVGLEAWAVGG